MSEPDCPDFKLNLLLAKADGLEAKLLQLQTTIYGRICPERRPTRSAARGRDRGHQQDEQPAWARDLADLLIAFGEEVQAELRMIRSEAIAANARKSAMSKRKTVLTHVPANQHDGNTAMDVNLQADGQSSSSSSRDGAAATSSEEERVTREGDPEETPMTENLVTVSLSKVGVTARPVQAHPAEGHNGARQSAQISTNPDTDRREDVTADAQVGVQLQPTSDGAMCPDSDNPKMTSTASTADTCLASPGIGSPDTAPAPGSSPKFTLSAAELGEGLVPALQKIIPRQGFDNEISVDCPPIDLDVFKTKLSSRDIDCQYAANVFKPGPKGEGYTFVYISERKLAFKWPDLPQEVKLPTEEEARKYLDHFFSQPPRGTVQYFSGHLDVPYERLLNPGPEILGDPDLSDLHRPYWHIGSGANRFHIEDLSCLENTDPQAPHGLRSANLVLVGVKLWILIAMHHTHKFEQFITTNWKCNECSHRVGHRSLLISPSRLEKEGIEFAIKVAGPGTLIAPHLCQYHGVVNMGFCIALSINYTLPGDNLVSKELRCCGRCGVSEFTHRHGVPRVPSPDRQLQGSGPGQSASTVSSEAPRRKRKAREAFPEHPAKTTRASTAAKRKWQELEQSIKMKDPGCFVPTVSNPSESQVAVIMKAASIQSSHAAMQFKNLVREWRRRESHVVITDETDDALLQQGRRLKTAAGQSLLSKFELRYAQACLARAVDQDKKDRDQLQPGEEPTELLAKQLEMDGKELNRHLEDGRLWNSICGPEDDEIMPFVPLDSKKEGLFITKKGWRALSSQQQRTALSSLLDNEHAKNLRQAGGAFVGIIMSGSKHVFKWETEGSNPEEESISEEELDQKKESDPQKESNPDVEDWTGHPALPDGNAPGIAD
ncbi:hypothetical protein B0J13DRAFT_617886 [Dactylonectria estremocensis]|uniref:JmjC domain-containing protein n=1 Tax=Dactylonectria estremocensis TaxID=1079267 RepID=A0A9P9FC46_9HYPO|nr:hypothetical protein B0J13DRAFT_617886 [Dactylonectria estremocensis]